jgi:hypothetical protein
MRRLLLPFFLASSLVHALPPDTLFQPSEKLANKWGLASLYRFREVSTAPKFSTDFAVGVFYQLPESRFLLSVKRNTFALGYSFRSKLYFLPELRWTSGIDYGTGKVSLFQEAQASRYFGKNHEMVMAARIQNTGFSVESGDGAEFDSGSIARYWHFSAELGYRYRILNDLEFGASALYRYALGAADYASPLLAHLSVQWFWGEP